MGDVLDPPVVRLVDVGKRFAGDPPVDALLGVDLAVHEGEWLAITGPSGSGKSTLLHILGCLDQLSTGSYQFDGIEVSELGDRQRAGLRARGIGFVFQSFHLLGRRSVTENVMLADIYRCAPRAGRRDRALAALDRVGLANRADFGPTRLSGGERQRVAIARALTGSPRLLLCDEPTGNLDSAATANVLGAFRDLNQGGMTIVMITHEEAVAAQAGRRVRIADGVLIEGPR